MNSEQPLDQHLTDEPQQVPRRHEIWKVLDAIQMDLRAAQAKLVTLRSIVAQHNYPDATSSSCPECGLKLRGPRTLEEHLYQTHDGPEPAHWLDEEDSGGLHAP